MSNYQLPNNLPDNEFVELLKAEYIRVIKKYGNFKKIVWNGKTKEFIVTL